MTYISRDVMQEITVGDAYRKYSEDGLLPLIRSGIDLFVSSLAERHPLVWEYRYRLRNLGNRLEWRAVADPFKLVRVSPDRIERHTRAFDKWESVGLVTGGDWDRTAEPLERAPKCRGCFERFVEGKDWEETAAVPYVLDRIQREGQYDGCTTRSDVLERYRTVDDLYRSVRENGFLSERELDSGTHDDKRSFDYVAVHVGRTGELIFARSGCHRLAIAKILDVDEIPVWVRARHAEWQRTRDAVADRGSVGEPLRSHPDLQDVL